MRILAAFLAGTGFSLACALPATAAIHEIGVVNISASHYTDVRWSRFDGPLARLSFLPDNDAIDCDHITINYQDGTSHDVFSGFLLKQQRETVRFPEGSSPIRDVDFACKAQSIDGARIALSSVTDEDTLEDNLDINRPAHVRVHEHGYPN